MFKGEKIKILISLFSVIALFFFLISSGNYSSGNNDEEYKLNRISGYATHPLHSNYSSAENGFRANNTSVSVSDDIIYKTGWYSVNGTSWRNFTFSGNYYNSEQLWLKDYVLSNFTNLGDGEHYVIIYSCKYNISYNLSWDCHGNKWQLIVINNTRVANNTNTTDTTPPIISFESPTPGNGSTVNLSTQRIVASVSDNSGRNTSSWINFDGSLIGYWRMDRYNSTGVFDDSPYSNFGRFAGGQNTDNLIQSPRGKGLWFDGVNDMINLSSSSRLDDIIPITVSAWINPTNAGGLDEGRIVGKDDCTTCWGYWRFTMGPSNNLYFEKDWGGYPLVGLSSENSIRYSSWQHVVVTYDGSRYYSNLHFYVNGVETGYDWGQDATENIGSDAPWNLYIGNIGDSTRQFSGSIDEVMIFKRVLSPSEIKALYNSNVNKFNASFSGLTNSRHNYTVYAVDDSGNLGNSGMRNFVVNAVPIATCSDGVRNQNEVFTDCGGVCPACECSSSQTEYCDIDHGTGIYTRQCVDGRYGSWGTCILEECDDGYEPVGSNECGPVQEECTPDDGSCPSGCTYSGGDTDCSPPSGSRIIINHETTDINRIPSTYINLAKNNLRLVYTSTSHGRQVYWGLNALASYNSLYGISDYITSGKLYVEYSYYGGIGGTGGCYDIGNCGDDIYYPTANYLDDHPEFNVVMWSWCSISSHNPETYIESMKSLITDYPDVHFVFMTGHTEGTCENAAVDLRNNIIRDFIYYDEFCDNHECILFDFADIEEHNPYGEDYMDDCVTENLNYDGGNWGEEYRLSNSNTHTALIPYVANFGCDHSSSPTGAYLNCALKGEAAWWMLARIVGWSG